MAEYEEWLPLPEGTTWDEYDGQVRADVSGTVLQTQRDDRDDFCGLIVRSGTPLRKDNKYLFGGKRGLAVA